MRLYTVSRAGITPVITDDLMTIIAPANKAIRIKRIRVSGEEAASQAMQTKIQRSTGGTGGGGALTPEKASSGDPAAAMTVYTTWTGQPALSGQPHYAESWNAYGGGFDLTLDGREIVLADSEQLSIRNAVGTGKLTISVEVEEI